jgi:hypothetical protein
MVFLLQSCLREKKRKKTYLGNSCPWRSSRRGPILAVAAAALEEVKKTHFGSSSNS